jgi:AbrB family looped-hinge helix DNA binding protein
MAFRRRRAISYGAAIDQQGPPARTAMSNITTLSSKFQISIPKEVRDSQEWKVGQKFGFVPHGANSYILVPVPTFEELAGIVKVANTDNIRDRCSF